MKEECKEILKKYRQHCQSKYFSTESLEYRRCQKLIQDYQKCINLRKYLTQYDNQIKGASINV